MRLSISLEHKIMVPKAGGCKHSQKHQIAARNQAQQSKLNKIKIDKEGSFIMQKTLQSNRALSISAKGYTALTSLATPTQPYMIIWLHPIKCNSDSEMFPSFLLFCSHIISCISHELRVDFLVLYNYTPSGHMITCYLFLWISYPTTKQAFESRLTVVLEGSGDHSSLKISAAFDQVIKLKIIYIVHAIVIVSTRNFPSIIYFSCC